MPRASPRTVGGCIDANQVCPEMATFKLISSSPVVKHKVKPCK